MKYARIDIETIGFVNRTDKFHINYGDFLQNIIIKDLYKKMGILDEVYVLDYNDISTYRGEPLILPINQAISHNLYAFLSKDIIPVYIGLSRDIEAIDSNELMHFHSNQPIGCRDESLYKYLVEKDVKAYLAGCMTITMNRRQDFPNDSHPVIVDAPKFVLDVMPRNIKKEAEYLSNVQYGDYYTIVGSDGSIENKVRKRYAYYREKANLIITSRMHVASPCIGMGIPTVFARNSIDYRLSWIDKYLTIFSKKTVSEINWKPYVPNLENIKNELINNAILQIKNKFDIYANSENISNIYLNRDRQNYEKHSFTDFALKFINKHWKKDDAFEYSLWGLNDAAEILYCYISANYPKSSLKFVYDSYKHESFHGITSTRPSDINNECGFIFVTGYTASDAARELFESIGLSNDKYFLFNQVVRDNRIE